MSAWQEIQKREAEWLANLKVGDEVVTTGGWYPSIAKITGETSTRWKIGAYQYRKDTGRRVGASRYNVSSLQEPTQEVRDGIAKRSLVNDIGGTTWSKLTLEQLRAIKAILSPNGDAGH